MAINKTMDFITLERLRSLVEENTSPKNIVQILYTEFKIKFSEEYIIDYILKYYDKEWSDTSNAYESCSILTDIFNDPTGNNAEAPKEDIHLKETSDNQSIDNTPYEDTTSNIETCPNIDLDNSKEKLLPEESSIDQPTNNVIESPSTPSTHTDPLFDALEIIDYLKTIHKGIMQLDESNRNLSNRLNKLENKISEMQINNPYVKVQKFADDLIDIYANEKSKKSVNVNPLINDRIIEAMARKYNITNNNSLAVNTALLLALYKSRIDDIPDKK